MRKGGEGWVNEGAMPDYSLYLSQLARSVGQIEVGGNFHLVGNRVG